MGCNPHQNFFKRRRNLLVIFLGGSRRPQSLTLGESSRNTSGSIVSNPIRPCLVRVLLFTSYSFAFNLFRFVSHIFGWWRGMKCNWSRTQHLWRLLISGWMIIFDKLRLLWHLEATSDLDQWLSLLFGIISETCITLSRICCRLSIPIRFEKWVGWGFKTGGFHLIPPLFLEFSLCSHNFSSTVFQGAKEARCKSIDSKHSSLSQP